MAGSTGGCRGTRCELIAFHCLNAWGETVLFSASTLLPLLPAHLLLQAEWDAVSSAALQLFAFGQEQAAKRGLLLVDTKYEFGVDEQGEEPGVVLGPASQ